MIADAVAHGARIVVGGGRDGRLVQPTLLDGLTAEMRLQHEEIFGPVVAVAAVDDLDEAIALANDSPYGLAAGVFTDSLRATPGGPSAASRPGTCTSTRSPAGAPITCRTAA